MEHGQTNKRARRYFEGTGAPFSWSLVDNFSLLKVKGWLIRRFPRQAVLVQMDSLSKCRDVAQG
jgi:hypothetical protein